MFQTFPPFSPHFVETTPLNRDKSSDYPQNLSQIKRFLFGVVPTYLYLWRHKPEFNRRVWDL